MNKTGKVIEYNLFVNYQKSVNHSVEYAFWAWTSSKARKYICINDLKGCLSQLFNINHFKITLMIWSLFLFTFTWIIGMNFQTWNAFWHPCYLRMSLLVPIAWPAFPKSIDKPKYIVEPLPPNGIVTNLVHIAFEKSSPVQFPSRINNPNSGEAWLTSLLEITSEFE